MANIDDKFIDEICNEMTAEAEIQFSANTTLYNKAQLIKALQYSKACNSDIDIEVMDYYINLLNETFIKIKREEA
tara:strand:- start:929 stop:1153 length:225 start_codon:yes stop_codon:yes gene_type:complete